MTPKPQLDVLNSLQPDVGLLLRFREEAGGCLLRITHLFDRHLYVMKYTDEAGARLAGRPTPMSLRSVIAALRSHKCALCRIRLPDAFFRPDRRPKEEAQKPEPSDSDIVYTWIQPLIESFDLEQNLSRSRFKALIQRRADELHMIFRTLWRFVLRFYYFGRAKVALAPLVPGPHPCNLSPAGRGPSPKTLQSRRRRLQARQQMRRGRKSKLCKKLGPNEFVVDDVDISEMFQAAKRSARRGKSDLTKAHDEYMKTEFARRHPKLYNKYLRKRCPEPVTYRQFRGYVQDEQCSERALLENLPALSARHRGSSARASGPGEIYEIDATGGRISLVDEREPDVELGIPYIYLLVDRWSRFIVSIYVTLGFPSWDEVRYALLVAFTSRVRRFRNYGIEIDEKRRWPRGRMCLAIAQDRGSELLSSDYAMACARDLRIEPLTLPPLTPDGKGVIERTIREIKRLMVRSGLRGVYAKRPIDPKAKRDAKRARAASVTSLKELYAVLVRIVDQKNNTPHRHLKRNLMLSQAGVAPTPKEAYLWGCKHITGARVAPLSDEDYKRMLLGHDVGSIAHGELTFMKRKYEPADAIAIRVAARSTKSKRPIDVRFDKTFREEIHGVSRTGEWSLWRLTRSELKQLHGVTMDEEELLSDRDSLNWAMASNDSRIERRTAEAPKSKRSAVKHRTVNAAETRARRREETRVVKESLLGKRPEPQKHAARLASTPTQPTWKALEAQERQRTIERMRRSN